MKALFYQAGILAAGNPASVAIHLLFLVFCQSLLEITQLISGESNERRSVKDVVYYRIPAGRRIMGEPDAALGIYMNDPDRIRSVLEY